MGDIFNILLLQNTLRTATPVVLAALGCLMTQHVNITNIGIDGMMLIGSFFAVLASYYLGSWAAALGVVMLFAAMKDVPRPARLAAAMVLCAACAAQLIHVGQIENRQRVQEHEKYTILEAQTEELLSHVPQEERSDLLAYRTEPKWYVAAKAMPYLRFYFLQEILAQADPAVMDEIVLTLRDDPPKWLVIFYNREFGPPYDPRVAQIFDTEYEFVDARGDYQLLRHKQAQ